MKSTFIGEEPLPEDYATNYIDEEGCPEKSGCCNCYYKHAGKCCKELPRIGPVKWPSVSNTDWCGQWEYFPHETGEKL